MGTRYYARMIDGNTIELAQYDHERLMKMVTRNVENSVHLESGDVLKSAAVIYIGTKETAKIPAVGTVKPTPKK
jgi:hypothetical protein